MDPFRDRVAVVTGGAGGIGMAMARAFAARGARLVLADLDEEALASAEKELSGKGAEVLGVQTDVTRRESVGLLADMAVRRFGAAHIVCNNAGVAIGGNLLDATPEDWEFTMSVNFWGVVHGVDLLSDPDRAEAGRPRGQHRIHGGPGGDAVARRLLRVQVRRGGSHRVAAA
jgi:NAD(P)-dependent dehydrogenase (short-subunit alcohol dehydrogenase family)